MAQHRSLRLGKGLNGGQEFGELKAQVAALADTVRDFRDETRQTLSEVRKEFTETLKAHGVRLGRLERMRARVGGALAASAALGGATGWLIKLLTGG